MASNASTVAIPAPANASFVNGEQGVGISGSPAGGTPYFASRIFYARRSGLFLFKVWANGPASVKVGPNLAGLQTVSTLPANTVVNSNIYLKKGANRVDVQLASASGPCLFAMLIYHPDSVLYASSAQGWVYQTGSAVPDLDIPASTDEALPVFSTLPNWASGITERISYLTDILESETAREQPRALRYHPRRSIDADFMRKDAGRARLDAFLTGIGRREFLMPLWHEQFRIQTAMTTGSTTVAFPAQSLALREFQVGDKVFVNNGDPEVFEVLTVASLDYDADILTWDATPSQGWPVGTRIIPMRRACIADSTQLSAPVDRVGRGGIRFELVDPEYRFGASWGRCSPVWHFPINRADDITFAYDRKSYTLDNTVGPVEYAEPGDRALITMRSALILRGRSNVVTFRRFIDMAAGRAGRFYMPTRMSDILPVGSSIGGTTIDAQPAGFTEFIQTVQDARVIIAVVFNDGSPNFYRRITDVVRVGSVERFTLEVALPAVSVDRIERLQFMVPSRFDQDTFEFSHLVDESAAVRTSVLTRSVDIDGMPDIDCYVTSMLYPLEVIDEVSPGITIDGGHFLGAPGEILSFDTTMSVDTGELRDILRTYNESPEAIDAQLAVDGGALTGVAEPHETEADDEVSTAMELTGGSLDTVLLTTEIDPDDLNLGITIESGTLS